MALGNEPSSMQEPVNNPRPAPAAPPATDATLAAAETRALLREYAKTRDIQVRNRLVLLHERLVRYVVARFSASGASSGDDLLQVGYLGLIAAIERYDPDAGNCFTTFAMPTMLGVIKHHLRDQTWLVKAPRRLRELATRLRKLRSELEQRLGRPPTAAEMAEAAGVSEERLLEAMEVDQVYQPFSLDGCSQEDDAEGTAPFGDVMGAADPAFAAVEEREMVRHALDRLSDRERAIIEARFFEEAPQAEVAGRLGISQMHVSRLERRALQRLKELLH